MTAPTQNRYFPRAAVLAAIVYLASAPLLGGRVPFVEHTMFRFGVSQKASVVPLFLADGELVDIERYTDFSGFDGSAIETDHGDYECSVEHKFHEARHHVDRHQARATTSTSPSPTVVSVEVGVIILDRQEDGRIQTTRHVHATGTARRR